MMGGLGSLALKGIRWSLTVWYCAILWLTIGFVAERLGVRDFETLIASTKLSM